MRLDFDLVAGVHSNWADFVDPLASRRRWPFQLYKYRLGRVGKTFGSLFHLLSLLICATWNYRRDQVKSMYNDKSFCTVLGCMLHVSSCSTGTGTSTCCNLWIVNQVIKCLSAKTILTTMGGRSFCYFFGEANKHVFERWCSKFPYHPKNKILWTGIDHYTCVPFRKLAIPKADLKQLPTTTNHCQHCPSGKSITELWVSINGGTPKWMVPLVENPIKMNGLGVPLLREASN